MPQSRKQKRKVERVMHEFKHGELESRSGRKVKNPKQAIAIAMSESGQSRKRRSTGKSRTKKARGGRSRTKSSSRATSRRKSTTSRSRKSTRSHAKKSHSRKRA